MKILRNGELVDLDAVAAAALQAEWAAEAAAQPARDAEAARVAALDGAISSDATVASMRAMTSAEFDAWWAANVTTVAQASNVLKRVTRVVLRRVL